MKVIKNRFKDLLVIEGELHKDKRGYLRELYLEKIIKKKRKDLDIIANGLLDYETLTGDEIINPLKGIEPIRENPSDDDTGTTTLSGSVPKTGNKSTPKTEPGLQGT